MPVALRPRFEGGGDSVPPYGFLLRLSGQPPLLEAEVAPEDLRGLRLAWRGKVEGAALTVLALALLGLAVLSRERQERSSTRASYLRHVGGILLPLTGARLLVAMAVPDTWLIQAAGPVAERLLIRLPGGLRRHGTSAPGHRRARRRSRSSVGASHLGKRHHAGRCLN